MFLPIVKTLVAIVLALPFVYSLPLDNRDIAVNGSPLKRAAIPVIAMREELIDDDIKRFDAEHLGASSDE